MVVGKHDANFAHAADLWPSRVMRAKIVVPPPIADFDLKRAANQRKPLAHAVQTETAMHARLGGRCGDIEAATIVLDDHLQCRVRTTDNNAHIGRPLRV